MSTAVATTTDQLPSKPETKAPANRVTGKLKRALDLMVWGNDDGKIYYWQDAARSANYRMSSMRRALEYPWVQAYLRAQKDVFRKSASAQNISRAVEIRDQRKNAMASLGAIKLLEQMDEKSPAAAGAFRNVTPGVTVIINTDRGAPLVGQQPLIEINPLPDQADVGHEP
jgi:hypothetical protein